MKIYRIRNWFQSKRKKKHNKEKLKTKKVMSTKVQSMIAIQASQISQRRGQVHQLKEMIEVTH
jgi:hypothetical protein